jgi:DNA polymerase-3 subunit gamma/tau
MKYQALARTWRPNSFSEMVGQSHVVKALSNALEQQRLHHAYLFTGTRGVGKTTVARIFAKALNCESGPTATPCGTCSSCIEIDSGNQVDLIEVDAASRTGVEQTRELLDNVQYRPVSSRYKIYLIDEVHMFSTSSFNALLKTLEEPPEHVKFLLATTDPKKCPITVLSRCLQFNLHPLAYGKISTHLEKILTADTISFEKPALNIIAQAANGSIRDSLSLLDQAISFSPSNIIEQNVVDMLGAASISSIVDLASKVANNQAVECLNIINKMAQSSVNFVDALDQFIALYHQLAVFNATNICEDENLLQSFQILNDLLSAEEIQVNYQILIEGKRDFLLSNNSQSGFEMLLLRLLAFRPQNADALQSKPSVRSVVIPPVNQPVEQPVVKQNTVVVPEQKRIEPAFVEPKREAMPVEAFSNSPHSEVSAANWHLIVPQLSVKAIAKQLANNCTFCSFSSGVLVLNLPEHFSILLNADIHAKLKTALSHYSSDITVLKIEIANNQKAVSQQTPAEINHQTDLNKQEGLNQSFLSDPVIQSLQQNMDARLIPDSVQEIKK